MEMNDLTFNDITFNDNRLILTLTEWIDKYKHLCLTIHDILDMPIDEWKDIVMLKRQLDTNFDPELRNIDAKIYWEKEVIKIKIPDAKNVFNIQINKSNKLSISPTYIIYDNKLSSIGKNGYVRDRFGFDQIHYTSLLYSKHIYIGDSLLLPAKYIKYTAKIIIYQDSMCNIY